MLFIAMIIDRYGNVVEDESIMQTTQFNAKPLHKKKFYDFSGEIKGNKYTTTTMELFQFRLHEQFECAIIFLSFRIEWKWTNIANYFLDFEDFVAIIIEAHLSVHWFGQFTSVAAWMHLEFSLWIWKNDSIQRHINTKKIALYKCILGNCMRRAAQLNSAHAKRNAQRKKPFKWF